MGYITTIERVVYSFFIFGLLAVSSIAFAAPLGETVNDDSSNYPIDTNVTQSEALTIAERVLKSLRSIGTPRLVTEEDGQVMWIIPYETNNGSQNEIVINTATGAYRLVLESDQTNEMNAAQVNAETRSNGSHMLGTITSSIDTATVTTPLSTTTVTTTSPFTLENQIIELLERIISLLRTQLLQ